MAAKTVASIPPSLGEPDEDDFLDFTAEITRAFVSMKEDDSDVRHKGPEEPEKQKESERQEPQPSPSPQAMDVALLLRKLGDELDAELSSHAQQEQQTMLARRSVWEVRYEDFESLCNQVYESCRGFFTTLRRRVSYVFFQARLIILELHQFENVGPREQQMFRFAGTYLNNLGLRESIQAQGGIGEVLRRDGQPPAAGTEV